jgi:hypothetical protein
MCGAWLPSNTGTQRSENVFPSLVSDGSTVQFALSASGESDYDSMEVRVPTGIDFTATSIEFFSRTVTNLAGTYSRAYVKARYPDDDRWTVLWSERTGGGGANTADISGTDGAVVIAAGIETDTVAGGGDDGEVYFSDVGSGTRIDLLHEPTVTVGAAANVDYYNGTLTVGAYVLTFTNTFAPDGTLTIDAATMAISSSASGHIFNVPTFSDPAVWMALEPGSNTITDALTATASDTWTHRDAYE